MYKNYGDRNFFECGVLVDSDHSDTCFNMLWCRPYGDEDDLYQFAEISVSITDGWIDKEAVLKFAGLQTVDSDPIAFAIACVDYYGLENFGADSNYQYDWQHVSKSEICNALKYRLIATDGLDVCW